MIVDLHLKGGLVIVVGAGAEGLKKVEVLLSQDCEVLVFSKSAPPKIREYADNGRIRLEETEIRDAGFLAKYKPYLVMAATNDAVLNREISRRAKSMGCMSYASDDPEYSDFAHPSVISIDGMVQVAVSTGGKSPVMAKKIRRDIEGPIREAIKQEDLLHIGLQDYARGEAKKAIGSQVKRKKYLYSVMNDDTVKQLIKDGRMEGARNRAMAMLEDWG